MSPADDAGRRFIRAPTPLTAIMYRFLAPELSAQLRMAPAGRASDIRSLLPWVTFGMVLVETSVAKRLRAATLPLHATEVAWYCITRDFLEYARDNYYSGGYIVQPLKAKWRYVSSHRVTSRVRHTSMQIFVLAPD